MSMMLKEKLKNYFSSMPKTFFIFTLVIICMMATMFTFRKTIIVTIDGQEKNIKTLSSNLKSILDNNGIVVGEKDKVSVNLNSKVKNGDKVEIKKVLDNGLKDLDVFSEEKMISVAQNNIGSMFAMKKIPNVNLDNLPLSPKQAIENNFNLKVTRVDEKIEEKKEPIQFAKEVKKTDKYEVGTTKVLQNGENGEKVIATKVKYEDGKEISREVISEKVTKSAIKQILAVGTLNTIKSSRGSKISYSKKIRVNASAYTADFNHSGVRDDPYAGRTASGTVAKRNPNGYSTIAVDPSVIPLGTKVYIEGYGYAIAEDTGGAIKGNKIDLYMNRYSETINWGRRNVNLYILN